MGRVGLLPAGEWLVVVGQCVARGGGCDRHGMMVVGLAGGTCVGCVVCSGLMLLCTTVVSSATTSSMSSSTFDRISKGLLALVTHWCTRGSRRIVSGAVMVFNMVATLEGEIATLGGAIATLEGVVSPTLGAGTTGAIGASGWPEKFWVSCLIAAMCSNFSRVNVWPVTPRAWRMSLAASNV